MSRASPPTRCGTRRTGRCRRATLTSVGVIGGGPAGLAAAYELRLAGHPVTVYEAADRLGGMMVLGIPEYRLARALITREIDAILELGIDVELGFRVGRDASRSTSCSRGTPRSSSRSAPDAVATSTSRATSSTECCAPSSSSSTSTGASASTSGERVVVVGGGNVAFDAARTALRAAAGGTRPAPEADGARGNRQRRRRPPGDDHDARRRRAPRVRAGVLDVTVIALESPDEIPADPEEIAEAESEGITIVYRRGPHRSSARRRVTGLETIDGRSVFDDEGRFAPDLRRRDRGECSRPTR